jgi:hypothetical protein
VPPAETAILTALQKLPAGRWGSAKEFGDALIASTTGQHTPLAATMPMAAAHPPAAAGIGESGQMVGSRWRDCQRSSHAIPVSRLVYKRSMPIV